MSGPRAPLPLRHRPQSTPLKFEEPVNPNATCDERVERNQVVDNQRDLVVSCLKVPEFSGTEHRSADASNPEETPVELESNRDNVRLLVRADTRQACKRL